MASGKRVWEGMEQETFVCVFFLSKLLFIVIYLTALKKNQNVFKRNINYMKILFKKHLSSE